MEFLVFWLLLSAVVGVLASSRGRSGFGWFLFSLVVSPLLSLIFLLAFKRLDAAGAPAPREDDGEHTRCPECRELVRRDARKCKHCGSTLTPQ